jgi:hypothetical protein
LNSDYFLFSSNIFYTEFIEEKNIVIKKLLFYKNWNSLEKKDNIKFLCLIFNNSVKITKLYILSLI